MPRAREWEEWMEKTQKPYHKKPEESQRQAQNTEE